jgi:hypothetical protein
MRELVLVTRERERERELDWTALDALGSPALAAELVDRKAFIRQHCRRLKDLRQRELAPLCYRG